MTRQILWATDVHLDHLPLRQAAFEFGRALSDEQPQAAALIVTGDIAEAPSVCDTLTDLVKGFAKPVYFVLGNHDYYGGSFANVDRSVAETCRTIPKLCWLHTDVVALDQEVALVGINGWYDAGYGDRRSDLQLTDFTRISELFAAQDESHEALLRVCSERAQLHARELEQRLFEVVQQGRARHVIIATHVPPFQVAAWHEGRPSDNRWAPFFSSKATGEVLLECAERHPDVSYTVLCGHTHGSGCYRPRSNLTVWTDRARYGAPDLAGLVEMDPRGVQVRLC